MYFVLLILTFFTFSGCIVPFEDKDTGHLIFQKLVPPTPPTEDVVQDIGDVNTDPEDNGQEPPIEPINKSTYLYLSEHLFKVSCLPCHRSSGRRDAHYDNYEEAVEWAEDAVMWIEDSTDPMPPAGKKPHPSNELIEALKKWIDDDYPKN